MQLLLHWKMSFSSQRLKCRPSLRLSRRSRRSTTKCQNKQSRKILNISLNSLNVFRVSRRAFSSTGNVRSLEERWMLLHCEYLHSFTTASHIQRGFHMVVLNFLGDLWNFEIIYKLVCRIAQLRQIYTWINQLPTWIHEPHHTYDGKN